MGSVYSCRRSRIDEPLPPSRAVHLGANANAIPANNNHESIFVRHTESRERGANNQPNIVMNAPSRAGAEQRNNIRHDNLPVVIDLISDDENDDFDFHQDDGLGDIYEASPAPGLRPEVIERQIVPPGPPAPANNAAADDEWEDFSDDDGGRHGFDGFDDLDVQDAALENLMMGEYNHISRHGEEPAAAPAHNGEPSGYNQNQENIIQRPGLLVESRADCLDQLGAVFPGICRDYVSGLYDALFQSSDRLIAHILDKVEQGTSYPTAKEMQKSLKRKREGDEDEEATRKYGAVDRIMPAHLRNIRSLIRMLLSMEFLETPMVFIDACVAQSGYRLFSAYRVLEEAHRTFDHNAPAYNKMKTSRKLSTMYREENVDILIQSHAGDLQEAEIVQELQVARRIRKKADLKREAERQIVLDEAENVRKAEAEGTMSECGCCFGDFPLNRMVHCNNEEILHWFCRGCAKQAAETEIGNSKYYLRCMSMDGCEAGFSLEQRSLFLDESTIIALERNEQEAVLRMAGIENLASCPFCPFAAEYPPVEENHEFQCQAPECEKISCRLCKLESHIPKSCEEYAKANGLSIRRQIEEAMSAALIRKCNKCGTPFVKEEGCNKMTCTRNGCFNVQCYVCSKSCSYNHFNDSRRGGKAGNCPLFESVEQRHDDEVKKAEKEALDKARAEHPEYSEDDLKVKMSEEVMKDDARRKANDPRAVVVAMQAGVNPLAARYAPPQIRRPIAGQVPPALRGAFGVLEHERDYALLHDLWDNVPPPIPLPEQIVPPPQPGLLDRFEFGYNPPQLLEEPIRRNRLPWGGRPEAANERSIHLPWLGGRFPEAEPNAPSPPSPGPPVPGLNRRTNFRQLRRRVASDMLNTRPQRQANDEPGNHVNATVGASPGIRLANMMVMRGQEGAMAAASVEYREAQLAEMMEELEQLAPVGRNRRGHTHVAGRAVPEIQQREGLRLQANQRADAAARLAPVMAEAEQQHARIVLQMPRVRVAEYQDHGQAIVALDAPEQGNRRQRLVPERDLIQQLISAAEHRARVRQQARRAASD